MLASALNDEQDKMLQCSWFTEEVCDLLSDRVQLSINKFEEKYSVHDASLHEFDCPLILMVMCSRSLPTSNVCV